jgi:hypothetical protein
MHVTEMGKEIPVGYEGVDWIDQARDRDRYQAVLKDAGIKELVRNSHESRRVEETSEGGQDSL